MCVGLALLGLVNLCRYYTYICVYLFFYLPTFPITTVRYICGYKAHNLAKIKRLASTFLYMLEKWHYYFTLHQWTSLCATSSDLNAYTCVHVNTLIHTCTHAHTRTHTRTHTCTLEHADTDTHLHASTRWHAYTRVHKDACVHSHMHKHVHAHLHHLSPSARGHPWCCIWYFDVWRRNLLSRAKLIWITKWTGKQKGQDASYMNDQKLAICPRLAPECCLITTKSQPWFAESPWFTAKADKSWWFLGTTSISSTS